MTGSSNSTLPLGPATGGQDTVQRIQVNPAEAQPATSTSQPSIEQTKALITAEQAAKETEAAMKERGRQINEISTRVSTTPGVPPEERLKAIVNASTPINIDEANAHRDYFLDIASNPKYNLSQQELERLRQILNDVTDGIPIQDPDNLRVAFDAIDPATIAEGEDENPQLIRDYLQKSSLDICKGGRWECFKR